MLVAGSSVRRKNVWKRKKKGGREENIESGEAKQKKKKRDGNKRHRGRVTEKRGSRVYFEK